ncbi:MAG: amino acid racemase [Deltaproteobacteria bacterium]|nr:amino acid racemase [Deltaproteobacteria bacterium]
MNNLIMAGADFIVIPCVSAHFFLQELREQLNIPILSIIDKTVGKVEKYPQRLQTVGLLAAEGAIRGGLFQEEFLKKGIKTLVPEGADLQQLMSAIFCLKDTKDGSDRKTIKKEVIAISNRLIQKGAKGIIAGCTEISIVLNPKDLSVPIFDTLTILSRAAIEEAGSQAL